MDRRMFDDLTRSLAAASPRRAVLATGTAVAAALLGRPEEAAAGCKKVGKTCDKTKDCCDGARCKKGKCACKGSREECGGKCYDLDTDEKHCGACGTSCAEGETCQQGVCGGEGGCPAGADGCAGAGVLCGDNPNCVCVQSIAGETRCGDAATNDGFCGVCASDADCAEFLGDGAFCIAASADSLSCCPLGGENDNICMLPCPGPTPG